jgi:pimeloyl-ACP methyl ester carboxylesterase
MVAQELAIRHPDRIERLVLCCTSSGGAGSPSYPPHELTDLPEDERTTALRRPLRRHCAGRYDGIAPAANSEAIVGRIPDAELRVDDGGHLCIVQEGGVARDHLVAVRTILT